MPRIGPVVDQSEDRENSHARQKLERAKRMMKKLHGKRRRWDRRWDPFDDQNGKESAHLRKG